MCGIFGYSGSDDAVLRINSGLKRLEYRGYDSYGIATLKGNSIEIFKKVGPIDSEASTKSNLKGSHLGIGHTRWATHGGVSEINAHPHFSTDKRFVLAQNGIVENYQELKKSLLAKGYAFISQTDTEVIVRLIEDKLKTNGNLREAIRLAFLDLKGRNTIIVLDSESKEIIAVRNGSPLVVGIGDGEIIIASDTLSFADRTDRIVLLDNYQMVQLKDNRLDIFEVKTDKKVALKENKLDHADVQVDKEGFEHFMIKEIVEQKFTIREAIQYSEEELAPLLEKIKKSKRVYTVGAGTAGFAANQIAFMLRKYAQVNASELKAYEMESYKNLFTKDDLIIAVSQSGETADTIEALEFANEKGTKIASIVNMLGSTITRMSDYPYFSRSGPEICVASTKAFTAQIAWGLLVSLSLNGDYAKAVKLIDSLASKLDDYFSEDLSSSIKFICKNLKDKEHFFVLGKGQNYVVALEGALKVKEITYKHFEGFPAGELKHGVIALVEKGTPVFGILSEDEDKSDMLSALAEVKARGATTIGIAKNNNELFDHFIKTEDAGFADPIANVIPFQLISYFLALELGNSPDKPRNLAKSVTVK